MIHRLSAPATLLAALLAALVGTRDASAHPGRPRHAAARTPDSVSVGYANGGALTQGQAVTETDTVRFLPGRSLHYGTVELVGLINRVAAVMHRRFRVRLTVGDLSARNGGPVGHHVSHQSGRDADLAFFVRNAADRPVDLDDYVSFDAAGRSLDGALRFDTARNWALLEALFTDRRVTTERVFISTPLRARLLEYGRAHGTHEALVRAQNTLVQPAHVSPHDNHFHIRIGCPGGDNACREGVRIRRVRHPRRAATTARRGAHPAPGHH